MNRLRSFVSAGLLLGCASALASEDIAVQNWTSPPYWSGQPAARESAKLAPLTGLFPSAPMPFVAVNPCRVADTRGFGFTDQWGPPSLAPGSPRVFPITGHCGIPDSAMAISLNITVVNARGNGMIVAYPGGGAAPTVSTLNYTTGQTVANAAIVPLGMGAVVIIAGVSGTDLILDVNGYYAPADPGAVMGAAVNPQQVAVLRWYGARQGLDFPAGNGPFGVAFDGTNIWVANYNDNTVTKLRASDGAVQPGSPFTVGTHPRALAFDGANIWVANYGSNNVTKLRASDGAAQPGSPFAVGAGPAALAFDGANIWVANLNDSNVTKLSATDGSVQPGSPFTVGSGPCSLAYDGTNIWVANSSENSVSKLRASDGVAQPGSPFTVLHPQALAYDGYNIWVANSQYHTVTKLRASDGVEQPGSPFAVGQWPIALAFDGSNVWVANYYDDNVTKLRASDGAVQPGGPFSVGYHPYGIAFDGSNVWVANNGSDTLSKL